MLPRNLFRSYVLVGIQFLCVGFILITGPILASGWMTLGSELLGLGLGLWALLTMTGRNLSILPDVRGGSTLVTHGPYRFIRHPMYTSLLLVTMALILDMFSFERFMVWVLLLGNLWIKLRYEEQLLARYFEEYQEYQRRTKRLVPFLI